MKDFLKDFLSSRLMMKAWGIPSLWNIAVSKTNLQEAGQEEQSSPLAQPLTAVSHVSELQLPLSALSCLPSRWDAQSPTTASLPKCFFCLWFSITHFPSEELKIFYDLSFKIWKSKSTNVLSFLSYRHFISRASMAGYWKGERWNRV